MTGGDADARRRPAPVSRPVALTIAGSDSGGGAGVQADVRTMAAHDTFPTSVVTAVTAQHTRGVERSTVLDTADVRAQYDAVTDDFAVGAAKTGMLGTAEVVRTVAECVDDRPFPLVVDPVAIGRTRISSPRRRSSRPTTTRPPSSSSGGPARTGRRPPARPAGGWSKRVPTRRS
jgi:hypothetical protein